MAHKFNFRIQKKDGKIKLLWDAVKDAANYYPILGMEVPGIGYLKKQDLPPVTDPELDLTPVEFTKVPQGMIPELQIEARTSSDALIERGTYDFSPHLPPPPEPEPPKYNISVDPGKSADWKVEGAAMHLVSLEWKLPGKDTYYPAPGFPRESKIHRFVPEMVPFDEIPRNSDLRLSTKTVDGKGKVIGVGTADVTSFWPKEDPTKKPNGPKPPVETTARKSSLFGRPSFWFALLLLILAGLLLFQSCRSGLGTGVRLPNIGSPNPARPNVHALPNNVIHGHGNGSSQATAAGTQGFTKNGDVNIYELPGVTSLEIGGRSSEQREERRQRPQQQRTQDNWPADFHPTIVTNLDVNCISPAVRGTTVIYDREIPAHGNIQFTAPEGGWNVDVRPSDMNKYRASVRMAILVKKNGALVWIDPSKESLPTTNTTYGQKPDVEAYGFSSASNEPLALQFVLLKE